MTKPCDRKPLSVPLEMHKLKTTLLLLCAFLGAALTSAQPQPLELSRLDANSVSVAAAKVKGHDVVRVEKDPRVKADDEPTFARVRGIAFSSGTIEVKVLSRLLSNAPAHARGFIGLAFRIDETNSKFEAIYIRPTNGRAQEQLRRNRSIQYFSFPDYKFDRTRRESPGVYESYADMGLDEWITLRIEVRGRQAKLFLNENPQPSLIVNDLKHGAAARGGVGLWVDVGTEGFFRDLKVSRE